MDDKRVIIFDTTLRDGEQAPGASLSENEKVEIAKQLAKLGVDVVEAGFPVSSGAQFRAVERIASEVEGIIPCGLSRAKELDIKTAYEALRNAPKFRIHTFSSTSDIHILGKFGDEKYGKTLEEKRKTVLQMSYDAVAYAKTFTDDVEFSAEDAGRTDIGYLADVIEVAIEAGATTVNIPDTTGYTYPFEYGALIAELKKRVKNIDKAIISVHCHDDLGMAVANSIAGVLNGARQVECTINGIGERAGNASLEEIVMALKVRNDLHGLYTNIHSNLIYSTSRMVSSFTGFVVPPNKAIVGDNAFAHESGIHQDGVLKNRQTYEIMRPQDVGVPETKIVLGRHSGRHGLVARLNELGYKLNPKEIDKIYKKFCELADKKKEIHDDDLHVIVNENTQTKQTSNYNLEYLQITSGNKIIPVATVQLKKGNKIVQESATGDGVVDATIRAIEKAIGTEFDVENYSVKSITTGQEAIGEVVVKIRKDGKFFTGKGFSTDVIEASAKAFLQAINFYYNDRNK